MLSGWWSRTVPGLVARSSTLFTDDAVFPYHPVSEVARQTLASAGEHLRLAWRAIEAGYLFPSSHFTVLRGALAASAQAVWMMNPNDDLERRDHGHQVIHEMYVPLKKYQQTLNTLHDLTTAEQQAITEQIAWIDGRLATLAAVRTTSATLNQTQLIDVAAAIVFTEQGQRESVRTLWRQMSCDAHVLGWSIAMRGKLLESNSGTGLATFTVQGGLGDIAQPYVASFRLLKKGWSLYDQRCEGQ
jgi:hypothetical protein